MNPKASKSAHQEPSFNSFMFGLTLGVLGAFIFGTKEGRTLTREILDSLPENLKHLGQKSSKENIPDFQPPLTTPEETPHHSFSAEAPPPPPPQVQPTRPEYYYHPAKNT